MMYRAALCAILFPLMAGECPVFVNRTEWEARSPKSTTPLKFIPPPFVVVHHSAGRVCNETNQCKRLMHNIQNEHMDNRHWNDIGYNFVVSSFVFPECAVRRSAMCQKVGGDGFVYEGRGWNVTGAHSPNYNSRSIGICLLGNFQDVLPSDLQLNSVKEFIECAKNESLIPDDYHLIGHRQGSATKCPGDVLFAEISKWPHFDRNPK